MLEIRICVASQSLPLRSCLLESRSMQCPRDMIVPELIFFSAAKVVLRFPCAGPHSVPFFAAPLATSTSVRLPAVCRHVANAKTAATPVYVHFSVEPSGESPDFDMGHLE